MLPECSGQDFIIIIIIIIIIIFQIPQVGSVARIPGIN
jgi:hypothetical protein